MIRKFYIFAVLLLIVTLSCKMETFREVNHLNEQSQDSANLVLSFDFGGRTSSRAITPEHIPVTDFGNYTIFLSGNSDNGDSLPEQVISLTNGLYGLFVEPGLWTLTAQLRQGTTTLLLGTSSILVGKGSRAVELVLEPVKTGNGTVSITFTIPRFVIDRLDPVAVTQKQITVGLYDRNTGMANQATVRRYNAATGNEYSFTYTTTAPSGQYDLKLTANYTSNTPMTLDVPIQRTMVWSDILYVEGNRDTRKNDISIPETILGVPSNPGTKLSIQGANWDGSSNNGQHKAIGSNGNFGITFQNEVLLVLWESLYNAEFYEVELLLHPNYGLVNGSYGVTGDPRYPQYPTNDEQWKNYLPSASTTTKAGFQMKFSGYKDDDNYYKTKGWSWQKTFSAALYYGGVSYYQRNHLVNYTFVADRNLVKGNFNVVYTVRGVPSRYVLATVSNDASWIRPPDSNTGLSTFRNNQYRIGLEGNCNALAILMHNNVTSNWYGIRLRAVNEYGYSDWIYYSP